MKASNIKCKFKHWISIVSCKFVICESYMFEFSVSKDMKKYNNNDKRRILAYLLALYLTLIVKELKIPVE